MLSLFSVSAYATDYQSKYDFAHWAFNTLERITGVEPFAVGWGDGVCQVSDDNCHHASTYTKVDKIGEFLGRDEIFIATCDYCGQEFHGTATEVIEKYEEATPDYSINQDGEISNLGEWICKPEYSGFEYTFDKLSDTYYQLHVDGLGNNQPYVTLEYYFTIPANTPFYITGKFFHYDGTVIKDDESDNKGLRKTAWICVLTDDNKWSSIDDIITYYTKDERNPDYPVWCFKAFETERKFRIQSASIIYLDSNSHDYICKLPIVSYASLNWDIDDSPAVDTVPITYTDNNGDVQYIEHQFFDQSTNTYSNPLTDYSSTVEDWNYDYSTRTFTGYTENGEVSVMYGDENITVVEGGNTYNYYYGNGGASNDGSGGSGSGSDDNNSSGGSGIWGKLGELLGTLLGGLIDLITGVIDGLLDSLISLVKTTLEKLGQVVNLFGSFGDALRSLWAWLPDEIITILTAGVSVVVFASVLKLFI